MSEHSYLGNDNLKRAGVDLEFTEEQLIEIAKCTEDPIYFIKTYVKIVNVDQGLVPFTMWPFQEEMVKVYHENRFSICKMPRQVGKTTTAAGYMLWAVLFQENYKVAILANKGDLAKEILDRIKYAYEYLPIWLQQGIIDWNKSYITFENGSRINAYATSASGVRGGSYNLVFLDEFAFVPHNLAQEFFTSTYPVISSGQTTKVIIVSTPNGLNQFYKMWTDAVEGRSTYRPLEIHWSMVPGRDEKWREETIRNTSEEQFRQEFETEFIGSSATLITGTKLKMLAFHDPIQYVDNFYMYEEPQEGRSYVLCADCAEGVMQDYSAFSIVDVTEIPYRQVGVFRDNKLPLLMYPSVIYHYAKMYNEAFVLIETNNIGQQVVDNLHYDLEYENILKLEYHNIKGQNVSQGFKRSFSLGMKTTKSVKKIGCANLKTLVETDKLIINDFNTIAELNTFARVRDSYEAEEGNHDDLVMTLVFFGWLTTQSFFKETTDTDIRRRLVQETSEKFYEDEMTPFGIYDDGQQEEKFVSDGDVWTVSDMKGYTPTTF